MRDPISADVFKPMSSRDNVPLGTVQHHVDVPFGCGNSVALHVEHPQVTPHS